jgi:single-stranded-DNA-specific exonuclease
MTGILFCDGGAASVRFKDSLTRMASTKRWIVTPPDPRAIPLAERLKVSPLVAQALLNRGCCEPAGCLQFLQPSLRGLHDPKLLAGVTKAVQRIAAAIAAKEKIVVYGDYDVDGITAVAILWHAITELGGVVEYYIPHRIDEGYGLNSEAIGQIIDAGAKLIITVDCGVTAIAPAAEAKRRGVDLIITDHHEWHDDGSAITLPDCFAIVHPRLPTSTGSPPPNPNLCGAGVAFKLAWGIGQAVVGADKVSDSFRNFLVNATAFAALGTIADVVPLVGENRILAHFGLGGLKQSKLTGITALIASANLTSQDLDSYHVGFLLGPRLNACGRMGHAALAVEMMTTASAERAREIADYLESQNRERQAVERTILQEAIAQAESLGGSQDDCRGLVLADAGWHPGVIGIVASRIVERFCKPTILIALNDEFGQGSGRSITGFHLAQALNACGEHLISHGGHEMAAGLRLHPQKLADFRAAFAAHAISVVTPEMLIPQLSLEAEAPLKQITTATITDLKRLGPFGQGNRKPLLCIRRANVVREPRRVGKSGEHLQLLVSQNGVMIKCIAFGAGDLFEKLSPGTIIDLAVEPGLNEYNGSVTVELQVKDLQFAASGGK